MYGELPSILQGAAQRETLSPDQLFRLQEQGIATTSAGKPAGVNSSSVILPLALGLAVSYFLGGGSKRRSLW
jgi:hypothetical protein